jgi:quercetin dioxygenase-like cupin family protein
MSNVFEKGAILKFTELIDYSDGGINSKQVLKSEAGNITLFSFDKGQGLSEHTAPFNAMVQVLDGIVEIKIGGNPFVLHENETIIMPAHVSHALHAVEKFKMLLTLIRG